MVWCGAWPVACSGTAFRTEPGTAGSSGGGSGGGGGGSSVAGKASQGGENSTGGQSAPAGSGGVTTGGGPPFGGAAGAGEGGAGGFESELPTIPTSGLVYWFKADAGVVESDGHVSGWTNQSGRGRDAYQFLAEQQPKLTRSDLLPLPVLELDGNDFLELHPIDLDVRTGLSFFAVAGRREQSACSGILELSNKPEEEDISFDSVGDTYQFEILGNTAVASAGVFPIGALRLLETVYTVDGASGTGELRVNGAFVGSLMMDPPEEITREKNFIGHSQYSQCTPLPGVIAEIIMYERPLAHAERVLVERYLKAKWKCCG